MYPTATLAERDAMMRICYPKVEVKKPLVEELTPQQRQELVDIFTLYDKGKNQTNKPHTNP